MTRKGRGFESHPLRHFIISYFVMDFALEKYSRGRRGAPAKGVGRETGARVQIPPSPPEQPLGFFERLLFFAKESIKRWELNPKRREPAGILKVKSEE